MSESVLEVRNLSIRYGRREVLAGVSFSVQQGAVYALLGRNGAGKTSLIRAILGQQRPDRGEVAVLGLDVWRHRAALMRRIGVVPEEHDIPPSMTFRQLASFFERLHEQWDRRTFEGRLERIGIRPNQPIHSLSKGEKRQVALAAALAHRPELLLLDDPTLGLDAVARRTLFDELIDELAGRPVTVLLTTHDLSAAELLATHVGILHGSAVVVDEEIESLKQRFRAIRSTRSPDFRPWPSAVRLSSGAEPIISEHEDSMENESAMSLEEIFTAVTGGMS
jgi:ABC-2 type transport system ATP-binding protein